MTDAKVYRDMTRAALRTAAREGRLMEIAFRVFQAAVYPGAPEQQVRELRQTFFAGAHEFFAIMTVATDDGDEITEGDEAVLDSVRAEIWDVLGRYA